MKLNILVRLKNPWFWIQIILTIATTILGYFGLTGADITSWPLLGNTLLAAISNPYVCAIVIFSVWNAINDPTTAGLGDSTQALTYEAPKKSE